MLLKQPHLVNFKKYSWVELGKVWWQSLRTIIRFLLSLNFTKSSWKYFTSNSTVTLNLWLKFNIFLYLSIRMTPLTWISDVFIRVSGVDPPYLHSWALIRSITAKSAKSAKFVIQRKTANFFKPHLADLAVTVNLHFRLAISVLKNLINSAAKL